MKPYDHTQDIKKSCHTGIHFWECPFCGAWGSNDPPGGLSRLRKMVRGHIPVCSTRWGIWSI